MRQLIGLGLIVILVGCQGPKGDMGSMGLAGPAGPAGPSGLNGNNGMNGNSPDGGGTGPVGVWSNCTPTSSFCDGNRLWTCSRSGVDATGGIDCTLYGGTTTNPYICSTAMCPATSNGSCCRQTASTCDWNIGGTITTAGTNLPATAGASCGAPAALPAGCPANVGTFTGYVFLTQSNLCPPAIQEVVFSIQRANLAAGQVATMPAAGVTAQIYNSVDASKNCATWTGTLTWNNDVPAWMVTFNLTCSEAAKSGLTLTGTMHGQI